MFFKNAKPFVVRFILVLTLLWGMSGGRDVQALSLGSDTTRDSAKPFWQTVTDSVLVTVQDTDGMPMGGLNVYAFNGTTYTGYNKTTNADGQAIFTLPLGSYRFRADLNGTQFWSDTSNHCNIPGCESASVTVSKPVTLTVLDTDGAPKAGLKVYAFNGSTYTGYNKTTDASGQAIFTLPLGSYRFRADLNSTQFWSDTSNHCAIPGCQSASVTVSKPVTLTVLDTDEAPKAGLKVYAFNGSTYTGYNKTTDASGQAIFTLPLGSYRFRADLNGTQFWSDTSNHCTLPGCESAQVTVTIPITVMIQDAGGAPKSGVNVYAFNGSTYTGYSKVSDASGQAVFTLPLGNYRFRADYSGIQYWSGLTNHCTLPGCLSASVIVGPAMTATATPTIAPSHTPTATYTATLPASMFVQVVQPNGGEVLTVGTTYRITWDSTPDIDMVSIGYKSCDSCLNWIAYNTPNSGYYDWEVFVGNTVNTQFKIYIIGYDTGTGSTTDVSDNYFTVLQPPATATATPSQTPIPTTTTITTSPNPSQPGQMVIATAAVRSTSGTPTGTVDFSVDDTVICTAILTSGAATCNLVFTETKTVVAAYHPDNTDYQSSSGSTNQVVGKASTSITIIDTPDPSLQGSSVNIHVMVSDVSGGITPTGTVAVSTSAGNCNITLSGGQGSCVVTFNDPGISIITADYSGDTQHLSSSRTELHDVLAVTPTPSNTPPPPPTDTPTATPAFTPSPGPTPVPGCYSIRDQVGTIRFSGRTMYLDIPNTNPYPVTISSVFVAWNYAAGHIPGDSSLWLQSANLNGTVFWTGNLNQPSAFLPLSTAVVIPANGTSRITFTFDKTYNRASGEQIQIQFSTPGCEAYPIILPVGSPPVTPVPSANLKVQLIAGEIDNNQQTQFSYRVQNTGSSAVSNISVRIYFTTDGSNPASGYVLEKYWDESGAATITGPTLVSGNNYYFAVNYGTASLPAGGTWQFQSNLHLSSWGLTYVATNDWWHGAGALPVAWTDWDRTLVYVNGSRVWGSLP